MFASFFSDKFSNCIPLWSLLLSHRLIFRQKTLPRYSVISLWSLKMECLKPSLSHLTLSLILIPFLSLLKQCQSARLPTLTNILNLSLTSGTFPDQFKSCSVDPILKKYNLDKEDLCIYRSISYLSFLSKLTERVFTNHLTSHLSPNNLLNSYQSEYTKHHSTASILLPVHDHIIKSMSEHKVTDLCILDLSAAFDTIDHSNLLHRLSSWFGLMAKLFLGLLLIYHLEALLFLSTLFPLLTLLFVKVFHKDQSLVLSYSYSILLLLVLLSLIRL